MGVFFNQRDEPAEERSLSYQDVWGSGGTPMGTDIASSGLRLTAVYAAVSLIADLVATAPMAAYRENPDGSRSRLNAQPTLVTNPSPYGTRIDWLHQAMASMLLRGNAYGYVVDVDGRGIPSKIQWLNPDDVAIIEEQLDWFHWPTYYWRGRLLDRSLVVHIPAFTFPGSVKGLSPLALFTKQVQTGLLAQDFGLDWFKGNSTPAGHLKNTARTLEDDEALLAKKMFKSAVSKRDVLVTGSDWDWKALSVNADESQFLNTIKATATQIAAIYRVSPEDVGGETATSLTYKTLEQDNSKLTSRTLQTWFARIEAALSTRMLGPQYIWFDRDQLSRGDLTSQMIAETAALNAGIDTLNEARAKFNKPPLTPEEIANWQAWFRNSTPSLEGVPPTNTPAPKMGVTGGANA